MLLKWEDFLRLVFTFVKRTLILPEISDQKSRNLLKVPSNTIGQFCTYLASIEWQLVLNDIMEFF